MPGTRRGGSGLITCWVPSPLEVGGGGVCMASEPLDGGRWKEIPEGHLAIARPGEDLRLEALR